jgi:hypothetical protein
MKKLILAALLILSTLVTTRAQEAFVVPPCKINLKAVIEILADYDLRHQDQIAAGQYWGLTSPSRHIMYISDEPSYAIRREAVLHELTHVCYSNLHNPIPQDIEEAVVQQQAAALYKELFVDDAK